MNLSTRNLRAFLTLVELRNFTRAAEQCHLSQSAFSALIRSLEEAFGVRLFDRDTRRVELTPAGRRFELVARDLLARFDQAMNMLSRDLQETTCVSVAAMPSLCARWLPPLLAGFQQEHPTVEVKQRCPMGFESERGW